MDAEKVALLEALPDWSWDPLEDVFQNGLAHLKEYVAREGTARVPLTFKTDDGFALGQWVNSRRGNFKKNKLDADKVALSEALPGWVWDASS